MNIYDRLICDLISTIQFLKHTIDTNVIIMKLPKPKSTVDVDKAKCQLENPLTKAQKAQKAADDAERLRKI